MSRCLGKSAFVSRMPQVRGRVNGASSSCAPLALPAAPDLPVLSDLPFPFFVSLSMMIPA